MADADGSLLPGSSQPTPPTKPMSKFESFCYGIISPHSIRHEHAHWSHRRRPAVNKPTSEKPLAVKDAQQQAVVHDEQSKRTDLAEFLVRLFSEFVGTAILVVCHGGLSVLNAMGKIEITGHALGDGTSLVFLIYALGEVGGAHFNPVVTTAMALRGMFPFAWIIPYWISQLAGAIVGGALMRGLFKQNASHGTSQVKAGYSQVEGMGAEVLFTFILVFVILSICNRGRVVGPTGALAVGSTILTLVMFGDVISSGSMNPFRSLGPAIVNGPIENIWVFFAGPFIGMFIAFIVVSLLAYGRPVSQDAKDAATGHGAETVA